MPTKGGRPLEELDGADPKLARRPPPGWFASGRANSLRLAAAAVSALALGFAARFFADGSTVPFDLLAFVWAPLAGAPVSVSGRLDGLALFAGSLVALACLVALIVGPIRADATSIALTFGCLLAVLGVCLAGDLLLLYLLWEALGLLASLAARHGISATAGQPKAAEVGRGFAMGHVTGYALLAAVFLLSRGSGGGFGIVSVTVDALAGAVPGLLLVAALGRFSLAWANSGRGRDSFADVRAIMLAVSAAYLLVRGLGLADGVLAGRWGLAYQLVGIICLIVGALSVSDLATRELADRFPSRMAWIDAGFLFVGIGVGGAPGAMAALMATANLALARLPAIVARPPTVAAEPDPALAISVGADVTAATLVGLPPFLGFATRVALAAALVDVGAWLTLAVLVITSAAVARAWLVNVAARWFVDDLPLPVVSGHWNLGLAIAISPALVAVLAPGLLAQAAEPVVSIFGGAETVAVLGRVSAGGGWPAWGWALLAVVLGVIWGLASPPRPALRRTRAATWSALGGLPSRPERQARPSLYAALVRLRGKVIELAVRWLERLSVGLGRLLGWTERLEPGRAALLVLGAMIVAIWLAGGA